ncbi:protein NKG7-like [Pelodiscus sinensis]|uniref:protein NKG7-like n=1 Tax=Pelodiscus sinensis TaxID=13735 RepID=UPI003F6CAB08
MGWSVAVGVERAEVTERRRVSSPHWQGLTLRGQTHGRRFAGKHKPSKPLSELAPYFHHPPPRCPQIAAPQPPAAPAMQPLRIVSTGLALLSLLLLLLALGSDHWRVNNGGFVMGLWQVCYYSICGKYTAVSDYVGATRAFLFLAMIAGGVSSIAVITSFFRSHLGPVPLTLVSAVGSFSAGLCAMIAMAVFTAEVALVTAEITVVTAEMARFWTPDQGQLPTFSYGWSFALGWASFPLFLLTGAVTMFIPKDPSS